MNLENLSGVNIGDVVEVIRIDIEISEREKREIKSKLVGYVHEIYPDKRTDLNGTTEYLAATIKPFYHDFYHQPLEFAVNLSDPGSKINILKKAK
jgi:hypothetical protein